MVWYFWIVITLGATLALAWPTLLQHEGSHAFVARVLFGQRIKAFKPYPHRTDSGGIVFGQVRFTLPLGGFGPTEWTWIAGAPMVPNLVALIALCLVNHYAVANPYASAVLLGWSICNLVDLGNNCRLVMFGRDLATSHTDLARTVTGQGIWSSSARFLAAGVLAGGIALTALSVA